MSEVILRWRHQRERTTRQANKSTQEHRKTIAQIQHTLELEEAMESGSSYLDLFKGTDLRRTLITCLVYASQNLAGNLIANQATYFFERRFASKRIPYDAESTQLMINL